MIFEWEGMDGCKKNVCIDLMDASSTLMDTSSTLMDASSTLTDASSALMDARTQGLIAH
jgi:hypothetical protein